MKKGIALGMLGALCLVPNFVSAHETQQFEIGHQVYQFVVGSLNEPVTVDDKTGVELMVSMVGHESMATNDHHGAGGAVTGLEETLQVEIAAGDKRKVLALSPIYGKEGAYRAPFYPTVATTYSYRFFGTLNGTPVDVTFTCNAAGHGAAKDDATKVEVSDQVTRVSKSGAFGCPAPKETLGFPEETASLETLSREVAGAKSAGMMGIGAGVLGLLAAAYAVKRK